MPIFVLKSGKQYACPFCGLASVGILYVDILGSTLEDALKTFGSKENTQHMEYHSGKEKIDYDGYNKILGVEYAYNNTAAVRVSLRRPYEGETA